MRRTLAVTMRLAVLSLGLIPRVALADESELHAIRVLKSQGIQRKEKSASIWVLSREEEVLRRFGNAKYQSRVLAETQVTIQRLEMGDLNPQAMIDHCQGQIALREARIAQIDQEIIPNSFASGGIAGNYYNILVNQRNALVAEQRQFYAMIDGMAGQRGALRQQLTQLQGELGRQREQLLKAIEDLHDVVTEVTEKYAAISKSQEVAKAIAELSATRMGEQKVEHSKGFQNAVRWLELMRGKVQSETFTLHREGGVDHLDVMLNGKGPVRMVFDTGAGPMAIPASLAESLGLKPTNKTVPCRIADGSEVMAKLLIIPSVRVGPLSVPNVECAVIPAEKGDSPALLGQTFLRNFDYKYTQKSGKLVLTKIAPDQPIKSSGPNSRKSQSRRLEFRKTGDR